MAKMSVPKMDVVRFNESDVIVASSFRVSISGLGNSQADETYTLGNNKAVTYNGAPGYFSTDLADYLADYMDERHWSVDREIPFYLTSDGDTYKTPLGLAGLEDAYGDSAPYAGDYEWNGSRFVHQ